MICSQILTFCGGDSHPLEPARRGRVTHLGSRAAWEGEEPREDPAWKTCPDSDYCENKTNPFIGWLVGWFVFYGQSRKKVYNVQVETKSIIGISMLRMTSSGAFHRSLKPLIWKHQEPSSPKGRSHLHAATLAQGHLLLSPGGEWAGIGNPLHYWAAAGNQVRGRQRCF